MAVHRSACILVALVQGNHNNAARCTRSSFLENHTACGVTMVTTAFEDENDIAQELTI